MKIMHVPEEHKFTALADNGETMGSIMYEPHGDSLSATHTRVSESYQGHGVAGKLLGALVEYAAANQLKIIPVCSYVVGAFEKHPEKYRHVM